MNLHDILLNKAKKQELAHFYIVESSASLEDSHRALTQFVHTLIREYYQQVEHHKQSLAHLTDHPDVFVMGNLDQEEKESKPFTVAESEALARFFEYRSVQSARKFAVITEAHRISTVVANKWLKLFEEPQGTSTIFLLNPRGGKLLETIHSRAIHLRLPHHLRPIDQTEWREFLESVNGLGLSQFLETHARSGTPLEHWVNQLIQWESEEINRPEAKQALENWLKNYQEMETFHQGINTRWTLFYQFLREHVLPRVSH